MLTTAQLIAKVRALCSFDLDLILGDDTTDADIVDSLNEAQLQLGELAPIFDPAITLTLPIISSGPCHLDLSSLSVCSRSVFETVDVVLNGTMLMRKLNTKAGPWSLAELENDFTSWRTDAPGKPLRWAPTSDRSIILHPAPDSTQSATGNYISGRVLPAALDADVTSGVSELPESLHPHLAKLAAVLQAESVASESRQLAKIQKWQSEALAAADRMGKRDREKKSPIGSTSGRSRPNFLRT